MEIDFNKKNSTEASIKIRLNKADYQPQVDKKVQEYAKKMNLKGFRPGKVPAGIVRKMYGKSILVDEINHILSHKLQDYIKDNDLKILGEPLPDKESVKKIDWETQEDFEFVYNLGMVDDFKLELNAKHKITKHKIKVDKKSLDETLKDIRQRFGKEVEAEKSAENDVLEVDLKIPSLEIEKQEVSLPISRLDKKVAKNFKGLSAGDHVVMPIEKITTDENLLITLTGVSPEETENLKGEADITVNGIKRKEDAEINQELFDQVFGAGVVSNEEEYLKKVEETIGENYNRESDNFLGLSIRKYFLEKVNIELPEEFLKEWIKLNDEKITDEDLEREFEGYAESLKWNLIQNRIAEEKDIKVEYEEVREKAKEMFIQQFGGEKAAESIKDQLDPIADNYLSAENGKNYQNLYENVRAEKIIAAIKENVTLQEKKVTVDEFTKIVSA